MATDADAGAETTGGAAATLDRRQLRLALRWVGVAGGLFAILGYAVLSVAVANVLTGTHNRPVSSDPREVGRDARDWSMRTADGVTLRGLYYPAAGRRLVVLVHGMGATRDTMAGLGRDLHARGFDVLRFDLRGHGRSDPHRLTMGRRERADVRAVLAWAASAGFPPDRIGWVGQSMGASTLLMEGAENPAIRVAVLDSPYGDLPELLDRQLTRHSGLPKAFNPGIILAARRVYGIRLDDLVPIEAARRWGDRPLLLIHGDADDTVPVAQGRRLAAAAGPSCRAVFPPGVGHCDGYDDLGEGYVTLVAEFLDEHLAR